MNAWDIFISDLVLLLHEFIKKSGGWILSNGLRIVLYIAVGIIVIKLVRRVGTRIKCHVDGYDKHTCNEAERRQHTLFKAVNITAKVFIWIIVSIMILRELGANIAPLLAGAGIAGVAIGFGAQNFVRDIFNGFLILFENQFRVGDVVKVADRSGVVEDINLRTTTIRDLEGVKHIIPNSEIKAVDNYTFSESRALVDVSISYDSSIDKAIEILRGIGDEICVDPVCGEFIRAFEILGVTNLGKSSVDIQVMITTDPSQQWGVGRRFNYLVKTRFDEAGITIPFQQHTVHIRDAKNRIAPS
jgi:moderate conductance mechanosensitive channel